MIIAAPTAAGPASLTTAVLSLEHFINFMKYVQSVTKSQCAHGPILHNDECLKTYLTASEIYLP